MKRASGLTLALGLTPLLGACGTGQAEEAPRYQLAEVVRQDLQVTAEATGQIEPVRKVEVKSKASGEVLEVLIETGDRVDPGSLLVRIDPRDVQNDYQQARADHEVAKERFAIAHAQLRRSENLFSGGVITEQEHEGRRLEYVNAQSNLVRAETSLELSRLRTEDVTIRAPLGGVVLERHVEEGTVIQSAAQNVSGGTTLLTIANLEVVQVRTLVDETDVGRIQPGMPVTVRVDAYADRTFRGVVEKIDEDTQQLVRALSQGTPIVITTIQKFPFISQALSTLEGKGTGVKIDTAGKRFAVIVDEAHSSQSGETATALKGMLNRDGIEAAIAAQMLGEEDDDLSNDAKAAMLRDALKRARQPNLSFFAFTATPKFKTKVLFDEPGPSGTSPFHEYTMRQAIEEGFIMDVLQNYTTCQPLHRWS
jgi:RND family efflux transporter MFP subunit